MTSKSKKLSFDFTKGYQELEKIVADFESRELDLEKDLPHLERGLELVVQLKARLKEIENKVVEVERKYSAP